MTNKIVMYGWHLSYFAGKVRSYLHYKRIPFIDQPVNMYTLLVRGKRKTGVVVMPTIKLPNDEWLQDSSVIIEHFEQRIAAYPVIPVTPVQRFTAYLMEAWGDEWWIPIAMHTRWNYPENYALFERDAGSALLPYFPAFLQRKAAAFIARKLRAMLHTVGIRPEQYETMNHWTEHMLDLFDAHFAQHAFLLGEHPTLADFGLVGTMYGHLGRDPWPARELIAPRRHLRNWIDRMAAPPPRDPSSEPAQLLADDAIAESLLPILKIICAEFLPQLEGIAAQVTQLHAGWPARKPVPRILRDVETTMGGRVFRRAAMPYTLWMAQRALDILHAMPDNEKEKVRQYLQSIGGERLLTMKFPRLRRHGVRVKFDGEAA